MPTNDLVDFDAARRERQAKLAPIPFVFGGERFTLEGSPRVGAVFDLADMPNVATNNIDTLRQLLDFVCEYLAPKDRARFRTAANGTDAEPVDAQQVYELVEWLGRQHANRPLRRSGASSGGRRRAGVNLSSSGSNGASVSRISRSVKASTGSSNGSAAGSTRSAGARKT